MAIMWRKTESDEYELIQDARAFLCEFYGVGKDVHTDSSGLISLDYLGILCLSSGYMWDGATGTLTTSDFVRASLVHDALYDLMRAGMSKKYRKKADQAMKRICLEDGMPWHRAWRVYLGVRAFGGRALKKSIDKPV